jgi:hypothetical protein
VMAVLWEREFVDGYLALIEAELALDDRLFVVVEVQAQDHAMRTHCQCFAD